MRTLGEDIVLLAIRPDGKLSVHDKLRFALAGSELVRLAAERRVDVVDGRIQVLDPTPTGDVLLDAAFASIQQAKRPPQAKNWVAMLRPHQAGSYLEQLADQGAVDIERRKVLGFLPTFRWTISDPARAAEARARIDAVAHSSGPVDSAQSALGGLVHAIGLDAVLYPRSAGEESKLARERLKQIARRDPTATAVRSAAERAAVDASIDAAVDASVHAAVSASVHAAHSAAHSASHDGGGGGGHH
ncbi:MAG TPA: GPP34 family phosphoprotein [Actinospica sp.]|jgi:hypothetical protein|nr:GPP34 family phosphoprotein [Actinospica sp.]